MNNSVSGPSQSYKVRVGLATGNVIMFIAHMYGKVERAIKELVQNAIDAEAGKMQIKLDLQELTLATFDNGIGASQDEMRVRVSKIGKRLKEMGKSGEKGLGNLAPVGIAHKYSLITHPARRGINEGFFRVVMDRELVEDKEDVDFDFQPLAPGFKFSEPGWTTSVSVKKIEPAALREIIKIDKPAEFICDEIISEYREKILATGIKITLKIIDIKGKITEKLVVPPEFLGRKETLKIETKKGPVTFEMYLISRKQKNPSVLVDYQGRWSFPLKNVDLLWNEISDVFGSGYIQGKIKLDFCTVQEDRSGFIVDDELEIFIDAVLEFTSKYGRPWLEEIQDIKGLEAFEEAVRGPLKAVEEIIKENPELMSEIFKASVSSGHIGSENKPKEERKFRTLKKRDDDVPPLVKPPGYTPPKKKKKRKERDMSHSSIESSTGTKRLIVKGQTGLQIIGYKEGVGWRIKIGTEGAEKGKILINLSHPDYAKAEYKGISARDTYFRLLLIGVVSASSMNDQRRIIFKEEYEGVFLRFMDVLIPLIPKK